jgi:hypothetical protein
MASNADTTIKLGGPGTPPHLIPSRLAQSVFLRYEPYIKDYMASWPIACDYKPENLNVESFAKALRNAIRSVLQFQWPTDIDLPLLASRWSATAISCYPTGVRIGPRETARSLPEVKKTALTYAFTVDCADDLLVKAAVVIASRDVLEQPVLLVGNPQTALDYIAKNSYDVNVRPHPDAGEHAYVML